MLETFEDQGREVITVYGSLWELGNDRGGVLLDLIEILQKKLTAFN